MVSVGAAAGEPPAYCIDPYEVTVLGDLGDFDQLSPGAALTTATTLVEAGVLPTDLVSYGQAVAACANTPVYDLDGVEVGRKRLPTASEWEDAGDGVLGEGGTRLPYGDDWIEGACATPAASGEVVLDGLQPTGSFPQCVSPDGVYDLIGNAWEWTDSGIVLDVDDWLASVSTSGLEVTIESDDGLTLSVGDPELLQLRMQGLVEPSLQLDADGRLELAGESFDSRAYGIDFSGYLVASGTDGEAFLPVWFDVGPLEEGDPPLEGTWPVLVLWRAEGATVPDKRGCAWYTGSEFGCALAPGSLDHLHDFVGTIGFRCVAEPVPVPE